MLWDKGRLCCEPCAVQASCEALKHDDVMPLWVACTGEGGNDLLGNKKQVADQTLVRGNLALVSCCPVTLKTPLINGTHHELAHP